LIVAAGTGRDSLRHTDPCEIELRARIAIALGLRKDDGYSKNFFSFWPICSAREQTRTENEGSVNQGDSAELTNRVSESVMGDVARSGRASLNARKFTAIIEEGY